ncbi:MAG TPA: FkbM family methyltransferase [Candidatus Absconditabacterales bacterium]|nr:FkbM family methyltransferase [Candidatus Absconditabacterales bacterium]
MLKIFGDIARFLGIKNPYFLFLAIKKQKRIRSSVVERISKDFLNDFICKNKQEKLDKLKKGLDQKSKDNVDYIVKNIELVIFNNFIDYDILFNEDDLKARKNRKKLLEEFNKMNIKFPKKIKKIEYPVLYKHGIECVPDFKKYIEGKDILDCGGYIGDSAMMFYKNFGNIINNIHIFEPIENNYNFIKDTIKLNGCQNRVFVCKKGVGDKNETLYMSESGPSSHIVKKSKNKIEATKIDDYVKKNNLKPGVIKRDIEGFEYNSLLGARKTIEKYKPILLISIYHNARDFFDIKPMIESRKLGYKFKIEKHNPNSPFLETVLICY